MKPKAMKIKFADIEDFFTILSAATIFIILLISTANVVGRYIFNWPFPGTIEICTMFMVIIIFFGISSIQRLESHVGMDSLPDFLKKKNIRIYFCLQMFHFLLFLMIMALIGYYFIPDTIESLAMHQETQGPLFFPVWPFKLGVTVGCLLVCIRLLIQLNRLLKCLFERPPARVQEN